MIRRHAIAAIACSLAFVGCPLAVGSGGLRAQRPPAVRDPFPADAAGWGPPAGGGLFHSRWAEDWTTARGNGEAPPLKAMTLGGDATLTLSAQTRLRGNRYHHVQLLRGPDYEEGLVRGVLGADLRLNQHLRVFGELAHGQAVGAPTPPPGNFDNEIAVSQAFVDVRGSAGGNLLGAMIGRQEFADGPRQLLSLGDGPNLHRSWNGVRLYGHGERVRVGAFAFAATRLDGGAFDDGIDRSERLSGANASILLARTAPIHVDPFWLHSEIPRVGLGGARHDDRRDTLGVRFWGRCDRLSFDWTLAHQSGRHGDRGIDAWGWFANQSLLLGDATWQPRLTLGANVATGGGADGDGTMRTFHQLYASSGYVGEARFLSLANLILCVPGFAIAPTPQTRLSVEYGFAWRFAAGDPVYGGGMRAYPGTNTPGGDAIGRLLRVEGRWSGPAHLTLALGFEHLAAGEVLDRAGVPGGSYVFASLTVLY